MTTRCNRTQTTAGTSKGRNDREQPKRNVDHSRVMFGSVPNIQRTVFQRGVHVREIGDPTLADGILDPLVQNAHRIEMRGDSMRKNRGKPNA